MNKSLQSADTKDSYKKDLAQHIAVTLFTTLAMVAAAASSSACSSGNEKLPSP